MAKKDKYEVGYGKPPVSTRFKKGESGNKSGRPAGSKNLVTDNSFSKMLQEEGSRFIDVRQKGKLKRMSTDRAIIRAVFIAAANGNSRAQKLAIDIMSKDENRRAAQTAERFAAAVDFKNWWAGESKRRKMTGEPEPDFMFHPDNFHLDYANGTVRYLGLTADETKYMEMMNRLKGMHQWAALKILQEGPPEERDFLEFTWDELKHCVEITAKFDASMGMPPWPTEPPDCPDLKELDELEKRIMKERGFKKPPKRKS
jgi:hypothetical protein